MADFIPVALDVKPPQGMSLGEMLNIANSAQQYQQAQQLNPLALQKARMEIEQAQQKNPLEIQRAQMEIEQAQKLNPLAVQKAETELGKSQFELNKSHLDVTGGALTGLESRAKIHAKTGDTKTALKELDSTEKYLNSYGIPSKQDGPLAQAREALKNNDMKGYLAQIENMRNMQASAADKFSANLPQLGTVGGAPATYTAATGTATPLNIGSVDGYLGVGQPPVVANAGGGQAKPTGVTATQMELLYPVRKAGDIRPFAPNEAVDTEKGASYRNGLTTRQTDLASSRRNLDEVIKAATQIDKEDLFSTGVLGALTRTVKGWAGDPKYKQLSKDLANVQISNMQAQGGSMDTVAGQHLQKMANGDETYPPDVLVNIARRTYADLTNLDMQATAASKFAQKYGDSNLNTFKRQWSSNADSKVFEAMSIFENVKDKDKRNKAINELFGNDPEKRQEYFQKYNNIKKLTATGEL